MRAVLLASATATTRLGRRRRSPITHGSALVAFERSRLALAPLISSRRRYWLPRWISCPGEFAAGDNIAVAPDPARRTRPCGSVVTHRRGDCCGDDRADARNARQALADGVALMPSHECFSIAATAASSCSICTASTCSTWRAKSGSRASPSSRTMAISLPTLPNPCGAITPNSARCPRKAFTRPVRGAPATLGQVQRHGSLLVSRLDRHKAHRRPHNRLADRRRIRRVVLVALDVGLHVLRRHQTYLMAKRAQLPRPIMRRRASLQADQTARQSVEERQNLRTPKLLAQNCSSLASTPCT